MHRFLAMALILVTFVQGTAVAYATTLGESLGDAITRTCGGRSLPDGRDCQHCCSHGSAPSCAAQCPLPASAALPLTIPTTQLTALLGVIVSDPGMAPFAEHDPPHPLRPPID